MLSFFIIQEPLVPGEASGKSYYFSDSRSAVRALTNGKGSFPTLRESHFGKFFFFREEQMPLDLSSWGAFIYPAWSATLKEAGLEASHWENWKSDARKVQKLKREFIFDEVAKLEKRLR